MKDKGKILIFTLISGLIAFFAVYGVLALQEIESVKVDSVYIAVFFMGLTMKLADVGIKYFAVRRRKGEST